MADGRLVISDFGLAIESDDNTTVHGGTPAYMPPRRRWAGGPICVRTSGSWARSCTSCCSAAGRVGRAMTASWPCTGRRRRGVAGRGGAGAPVRRLPGSRPRARPATAVAVVGRLAAAETARPRSWSARVWLRARGVYRRHRRLRLVPTAAIVAVAATRAVQMVGQPSLCRGGADKVAGSGTRAARRWCARPSSPPGAPTPSTRSGA